MTGHMYIKDYPRPQFVRTNWMSLNGKWDFCFDDDVRGEGENWFGEIPPGLSITVPFTYETKASGIGEESFHSCVWYQKLFSIPQDARRKRLILHFQAVDYLAKVWINGNYVGQHEGGYAAFSFDITDFVNPDEENRLVVEVLDSDSCTQPRGKQRWVKNNFGCWYVQTTGIWQSVWLEYVEPQRIDSVRMTPDIDTNSISFEYKVLGAEKGNDLQLKTHIRFNGKSVKEIQSKVERSIFSFDVNLISESCGEWKVSHWHPNHPNLYDVEFSLLKNGQEVDRVYSYFGMRKISIEKGKILLNNVPYYQRLLLDQGYWSDSHLTPPSEEALIEDIDKTLEMGFNGVRKHQKLEDPRFLYWCDRKGLLVWSEMAAAYEFNDDAVGRFTREWLEVVHQHYNHPCIVTWVPFNESWGIANIFTDRKQQQFTEAIYHLTKSLDQTRPVVVNDGWEHTISDIITLHDYEELGERFYDRYQNKEAILNNEISYNHYKYAFSKGYEYKGQPVLISEYGGIAFTTEQGWGYGKQVKSEEEFLERYRNITKAIKHTDYICGFCYTQITDVQQEVNGLLTEDRKPKVDLKKIKEINLS
jgi:beta-galactosidase/beta-glucuronidase